MTIKLFADQWRALIRTIVEVLDNPTLAYAVEKTDRLLTEEAMKRVPPEVAEEWEAACDQFEEMSPDDQNAWIEKVLTAYPKMEDLPDPEGYNEVH